MAIVFLQEKMDDRYYTIRILRGGYYYLFKNYLIVIDLGAPFIRGVLSDFEDNFLIEIHVPTAIQEGFEAIMN